MKINKNGQWELEGLEKMAYYSKTGVDADNDYFNYITHNQPHGNEKHESTTPVKSKDGKLVGDHSYSPTGAALTDKMSQHDAYHHTADTKQSLADAKSEKGTRQVFTVKDSKNVGKIPDKHLG
jgi:hypothetical protein